MITVVTAVDAHHIKELNKTFPTWVKYKNIQQFPIKIIYDKDTLSEKDSQFDMFKRYNCQLVPWSGKYESQREKMLTALTVLPHEICKTDWYAKIDTDAWALNDDKWFDESWLKKKYVFITPKWTSTKPANAIELLDNWGNNIFPNDPLDLPYDRESFKIRHKRIISWLFLCNKDWSEFATSFVRKPFGDGTLPSISNEKRKVSQDTYLWYIAERFKYKYKLFNFKKKGWTHGKVKL